MATALADAYADRPKRVRRAVAAHEEEARTRRRGGGGDAVKAREVGVDVDGDDDEDEQSSDRTNDNDKHNDDANSSSSSSSDDEKYETTATLDFCRRLLRGEDPTTAASAAGLSDARVDDQLEALQSVGYWLGHSLREDDARVAKAVAAERAKLASLRSTHADVLYVSSEDLAHPDGVTVTVVAPFGALCVSRGKEVHVSSGASNLPLGVRHNGEVLEPPGGGASDVDGDVDGDGAAAAAAASNDDHDDAAA